MEIILPLAILVFGTIFILRFLLGQDIFNKVAASWIFEISKWVIIGPFKLLAWVLKMLIDFAVRHKLTWVNLANGVLGFLKKWF